jgi:hypothetical protein
MESFKVPFTESGRMLRKSLVIVDPNTRPQHDALVESKSDSDFATETKAQKLDEKSQPSKKLISYGQEISDGELLTARKRNWLKGLSSEQIANLVVPSSRDQHFSMWLDMAVGTDVEPEIEKRYKTEFERWAERESGSADFSESSLSELRNVIIESIDGSPLFKWAVEQYGFPVVTMRTKENDEKMLSTGLTGELVEAISKGEESSNKKGYPVAISNPFGLEVSFSPRAILEKEAYGENGTLSVLPKTSPIDGEKQIDKSISGYIRHEWGHFLHRSLLNDIEMARTSWVRNKTHYNNVVDITEKYNSIKNMMDVALKPFGETLNMPRSNSMYSHMNMAEMFAEGISAYLHPDEDVRVNSLNILLSDDIEKVLGKIGNDMPWEDDTEEIEDDELQQ